MKKVIGFCLLVAVALGGVLHAEDSGELRARMLKDIKDLNSPLTVERISAMQSIATYNDPAILDEFKVIDKLIEMAQNEKNYLPVRRQALKTLVSLYNNGISIPKLVTLLKDIVSVDFKNRSGRDAMMQTLQLKLMALELLVDVASSRGASNVVRPEYDKVYVMLTEMWSKKRNLPVALQVAIIQAIGGFGDKSDTVKILSIAINDKDPSVALAAIQAISTAIQLRGDYSRPLLTNFSQKLVNASDPNDSQLRVALLDVMQTTYDNGVLKGEKNLWKPSEGVSAVVSKMLNEGDNYEVSSAVRFLMRISGQDPAVSTSLLAVAKPNPAHELSLETIKLINGALIDVMLNITNTKNGPTQYKDKIEAIIQHMFLMLNPQNKQSIPEDIRQNMIMGLACVPIEIDRTNVVQFLIALLENEASEAAPSPVIIQEIEDALVALTGVQPFVIVKVKAVAPANGGSGIKVERIETPNIDAWKYWYDKNKDKLVAGQSPFVG